MAEFQSTLYASVEDMLKAVAHEYWTGCGSWSPEVVDELIDAALAGVSPQAAMLKAAEMAVEGFGLNASPYGEPSHMSHWGYGLDDLADAMEWFAAFRPDRHSGQEVA